MSNRGLVRGMGLQAEHYTPLIGNDGATQPLCDAGTWGRYSVLIGERGARVCIGHASFLWSGSGNAGNGTQYQFSLPMPIMDASGDGRVAGTVPTYAIGSGLAARILMTHGVPGILYSYGGKVGTSDSQPGANITGAGLDAPGWAYLLLGHYTTGGTGSFVASTTKTQAHGLGTTPDAWAVTSQDQALTSRIGATADATNLNLTAATSSSSAYTWMAMRTGGIIAGPTYPWAWASSGDVIEIDFMYPVA